MLSFLVIFLLCLSPIGYAENVTNEELYRKAIQDAITIEPDEILPLIEISKSSNMCTWNEHGEVLMVTYHAHPDEYSVWGTLQSHEDEIWTFTDREIVDWYKENREPIVDWELRFKQLIGLPEKHRYTHFTALWVHPDNILRPGYAHELSDTIGAGSFEEEPPIEYKQWFDANIIWSYFDSAYPWTRLGYTYDWADNGTEYGLSEFLVKPGSEIRVEFTYTTDQFVEWMDEYIERMGG